MKPMPATFVTPRKASSTYGGGNCVEVKPGMQAASGRFQCMYIVDSYKRTGRAPILAVPTEAWREFITRIKADEVL